MSAAGFDLPSLLAAQGQGQGQPIPGDQPDQAQDPLQVLQDCLNALPGVIAALPDPQDTQDAIQALHVLSKIQTRMISRQQQG